jgi:hypothetical protein
VFEKGEVKLDKSKTFEHRIRHSPYCYGYKSDHGLYQVKWAKGWKKFPTWSVFEPEKWTAKIMDAEDRQGTYLVLPELRLDTNLRQLMIDTAFKREALYRESVKHGSPAFLFRNHQACNKFGTEHQCPYFNICWHGNTPTQEAFSERIDHHGNE